METSTKTKVILKALDIELKAIIMNDLKRFRAAQEAKNQSTAGKQLLAA